MKTLLSITRRPAGLSALVVKATQTVQPDQLRSDEPPPALERGLFQRVVSECSVEQLPLSVYPQRDALLTSWNALRKVARLERSALSAIRRVIDETEPCGEAAGPVPSLPKSIANTIDLRPHL